MTKYTGTIRNLLQGVSQQADYMRQAEQLESLVNCKSSITRGLGKRPGTYFTGVLGTTLDVRDRTFYHYDRGDTEEAYLFSIGDGSLKIYDIFTATEKTVNITSGAGYLAATDPDTAFKFFTKADTTFIVNSEVTPVMQNPTTADTVWQRMIYCKQANYGKTYTVVIDDVDIATYTTSTTGTITTEAVIGGLQADINTWATTNGVTFEHSGDVIYLTKTTGDYKVKTEDGNHGRDLYVVGNEIDEYANLSALAKDGYKLKVTGLDESKDNDYYVQFYTEDDLSIGQGVWKECAGFGVNQDFDPSTMPIQVLREDDGTFTVSEIEWVSRSAGDDTSNPEPSFVGSTITDILMYQGRLVFTSEENVIASVVFDFFNFFAPSVLRVSGDDPIDTMSSDKQVTNLHHTLMFNSALVSFSDSAQFFHPGNQPFSNDTFSLVAKAKYPSSPSCPPVAAATSVFFPYSFGVYSGVREVQYDAITGNLMADASTEHVTKYIKGDVKQVEASTGYNMLFVRSDGGQDYDTKIYIYEWYNQGETRLQSAWSTWEFSRDVLYIGRIRNKVYMLMDTGTDVVIEYINLADEDTTGVTFPVRLDMLEKVQGVPNYTDDLWEVPSTIRDYNTTVTIVAADNTGTPGLEMVYTPGTVDSIPGEYILMLYEDYYVDRIYVDPGYVEEPEVYFWVGIPFTAEGVITTPFVRDANGEVRDEERLRLNYIDFNLNDTGSVTLYCTKGTSTFEKKYNARLIDRIGLNPNDPPEIGKIKLRLGVRSDRDRAKIGFKSDEYTPFSIVSADWSGNFSGSGRRSR